MDPLVRWIALVLETARSALRRIGPYVLLELLMPGGTLLALGLFMYRRRQHAEVCRAMQSLRAIHADDRLA